MCNLKGHMCLWRLFKEDNHEQNCSCYPDCTRTTFDITIVKEPIKAEEECSDNYPLSDYTHNYLVNYINFHNPCNRLNMVKLLQTEVYNLEFWNLYNYIQPKTSKNSTKVPENGSQCQQRISEDFAIVDVVINSPFVMRLNQDVRVSIADKISSIGNL